MHLPNAINIYEQVHNQWNNRIDEVISEYGNESLAEQEPVWNILNAVQHKVRKKTSKISPSEILHQLKNVHTDQNLLKKNNSSFTKGLIFQGPLLISEVTGKFPSCYMDHYGLDQAVKGLVNLCRNRQFWSLKFTAAEKNNRFPNIFDSAKYRKTLGLLRSQN